MKIYIYTIPKAGTYFLAEFVGRLGITNTGYHVSGASYQDTRSFDNDTNREVPHTTEMNVSFVPLLLGMKDRELAFGHFPAAAVPGVLPGYSFICSYRHPRKTLVSEFIDFRFRRKDVEWVSPQTIPDDQLAFETYLRQHGHHQEKIFSNMLAVAISVSETSCTAFPPEKYLFVNFDELLDTPGPVLKSIAKHVGYKGNDLHEKFQETLGTETKTKATSLEVDREALWSDRANDIYRSRSFDAIVERAITLGWTLSFEDTPNNWNFWKLKWRMWTNRL